MQTNVTTGGWIEYDSNNSGGDWWLEDEDWKALEAAGWEVKWYAHDGFYNKMLDPGGRFLGALAGSAKRYGVTRAVAITEWEAITGQWHGEEGCSCCGRPHNFYAYSSSGAML